MFIRLESFVGVGCKNPEAVQRGLSLNHGRRQKVYWQPGHEFGQFGAKGGGRSFEKFSENEGRFLRVFRWTD